MTRRRRLINIALRGASCAKASSRAWATVRRRGLPVARARRRRRRRRPAGRMRRSAPAQRRRPSFVRGQLVMQRGRPVRFADSAMATPAATSASRRPALWAAVPGATLAPAGLPCSYPLIALRPACLRWACRQACASPNALAGCRTAKKPDALGSPCGKASNRPTKLGLGLSDKCLFGASCCRQAGKTIRRPARRCVEPEPRLDGSTPAMSALTRDYNRRLSLQLAQTVPAS